MLEQPRSVCWELYDLEHPRKELMHRGDQIAKQTLGLHWLVLYEEILNPQILKEEGQEVEEAPLSLALAPHQMIQDGDLDMSVTLAQVPVIGSLVALL